MSNILYGKFGIINFSNNCYLNVIIQLFFYNKNSYNIIINYLDVIKKEDKNLINPKKLMLKLSEKIDISKQNDSHEIFTFLLELIPDLNQYYINKIKNIYICQECDKPRTHEDIFSTFYIHTNSIEDSVRQFISEEKFELQCNFCKKNTLTKKKSKITKLGDVLIFYNIQKKKLIITQNITFNSYVYKLSGIIKHFGDEKSGHYIFIDYKNKLIIDDTKISKLYNLDMNNIYLLFYT